jgi:hypothetical protein
MNCGGQRLQAVDRLESSNQDLAVLTDPADIAPVMATHLTVAMRTTSDTGQWPTPSISKPVLERS